MLSKLRTICNADAQAESILENFVRLIHGAECSSDSSSTLRDEWSVKQKTVRRVLNGLLSVNSDGKRPRDEDMSLVDGQNAKRPRLSPPKDSAEDGQPLFTLHSISTTSPVRKKVDVTVHKSVIKMVNPSNQMLEAVVPLTAVRRAFLIPTRGKSKAHWTVVLLSTDIPNRGKASSASAQENPQVIFGLDATTASPLNITTYDANGTPKTDIVPKGEAALPSIRTFLSHLGVEILEPCTDVFKSACVGAGNSAMSTGIPGIEAYRAAKAGSLWFMKEGILWGESKPCEFWSVEDLLGKSEGLRMIGSSGRTCTVILTRKNNSDSNDDEDEDIGEETEFGMVDAREKEGINDWVRKHQHLFGKKNAVKDAKQKGLPLTIKQLGDESDASDEDFMIDSDELDYSGSELSSDEEENGSDSGSDGDGEDAENSEASGEDVDEEEELDPKHHPLLKAGTMPRMSRAAIDMAVGLVSQDLMGDEPMSEAEDELEDELDE
ncbi:histone chaperone Rttp106-like-domain-containing protein [Cyathus striatus]|nr:histone chaperone Rttp106-like-domain-containing protein [Cyathus striatus]